LGFPSIQVFSNLRDVRRERQFLRKDSLHLLILRNILWNPPTAFFTPT
jgi:hypothetical protein